MRAPWRWARRARRLRARLPARTATAALGDLLEEFGVRVARDGRWRTEWWLHRELQSLRRAYARELEASTGRRFGHVPLAIRTLRRVAVAADVRSVVRSLMRARGFAAAAAVTFALGATINITVFSVVDRLMFRPLPYADPARLVQLHQLVTPANGDTPPSLSILSEVSLAIAERTKAFSGVAWAEGRPVSTSVVAGESPLILSVATWNILDVLGVRPELGRGFGPDDAGAPIRSVILTHEAWQRQFGGSPGVLGARWTDARRRSFQVIGVLPPGFLLPSSRFMEQCDGLFAATGLFVNLGPGAVSAGAVARLRPGVSLAAADADVATLMTSVDQWGSAVLRDALRAGIGRRVTVQPLRSGLSMLLRPYLWLLVGGAWVLLGVACVNLSILLLARGRSRERDVAIRTSLGASPVHLISRAVIEALMLCAAGWTLGVLVSTWVEPAVLAVAPSEFRGFAVTPLNGRVLAITLAVTAVVAVFSASGPAMTALRLDVMHVLHTEGRSRSSSRRRGSGALLASEAALGAALTVGAIVAISAFLSLVYRSPGYQPRDLYTVEVPHGSGGAAGSDPSVEVAARPTRVHVVLEVLRGLPQVQRAAAMLSGLFGDTGNADLWTVPGAQTSAIAISDGWFETLGAALRAGRVFTKDDIAEARQIGVLNEAGVHLLWPHVPVASAAGRTVSTSDGGRVIVGVVGDVHLEPGTPATPTIYIPITAASARSHPGNRLAAILRMTPGARPEARTINARLNARFPRASVDVGSVERAIEPVFGQPRLVAVLFGTIGCLALVLSGLGLYAVASLEAWRRRHEMGIRLALGDTQSGVALRLLLVTLRPVVLGTAVGLTAAWWVSMAGAASVVGVGARSPLPYAAAALLMLSATVLATSTPVLRTSRVNVVAVLRLFA